jgi:pimeloyl-ACP methyl ester carboxylesterase
VSDAKLHSRMSIISRSEPAPDAPPTVVTLEHDGCRFAYRLRGEGPPVVFIQGVGLHGDGWWPQVDALDRRYACLTFDNRGMAQSQPVAGTLSVERMAADTLALMDAVGWSSAHLVGHSLGALVALHVALSARHRVRSLALLCAFAKGSDATRVTWPLVKVGVASAFGSASAKRRAFLSLVLPPSALRSGDADALAADLAPSFGHDLAVQPPVANAQIAAMRRYDATPRLAELAGLPTLVASAEHDPIAPPVRGRRLAAGIPGARYVEWRDAAHGVTLSHADEVNALLAEHLAGSHPHA